MNIGLRQWLILCGCALTAGLLCTPVSNGTEEATVLRLSLEENGRTDAEFSGAPIEAIIELDRDTSFGVLNWHTGQGDPLYPDTVFRERAKRFSIGLFWMRYPLYRDTIDSCYYDTVWVSMGGALKKSNKVRVKVTNLPVVMDSARFDTLFLLGQDTVWQCLLPNVLKTSYRLHIYARDLDRKPPTIKILGNKGKIIQPETASSEVEYQPPVGDFIDTMSIVAYDQMRGQAVRTLILHHITPNIPPHIDSIQIRTTMLNGSSMADGIYRVGFVAFDTLRLRLFARDSSGSVRKVVWSAEENEVVIDSLNSMRATYVCPQPGCRDTVDDSSVVIDIITVTVFDDRGDSTVRKIELFKGKINQPPQVRSLLFDNRSIVFADTAATVNALGGTVHPLKLNATHPEGKTLTVTWNGSPSSRLTEKTDSTARYAAPAENDTDTVSVTVSDGTLAITRMLRIIIDDVIPLFDSISIVKDTTFKGSDTVFSMTASPRDTLFFIAYARDLDTDVDSMMFVWTSGKQDQFSVRIENRARYVVPDTSLNDTIIMTLHDGEVQLVRKIVLKPENRPPAIDSVLGDDARLNIYGGFFYRDTAIAADTIKYRVAAHDPESEKMSFAWYAADSARLSSRRESTIDYFCKDTSYIDTLSIMVSDESGANVQRKILLQIDTLITP